MRSGTAYIMKIASKPILITNSSRKPAASSRLVRPNDSTNSSLRRFNCTIPVCGTGNTHRLRDHVNVFQSRSGIEDHHFIARLEEPACDQLVIGSSGRGSFGTEEDSFVSRPIEHRGKHVFIGNRNGCAAAAADDVENDVIA